MAGGAAGGFVSRAFEAMLKECSSKKYVALQTAVKTYLGQYLSFDYVIRLYSGNRAKSVFVNAM